MTDPRRRHLLFFAFPFPPSRGGGVYRTVASANHFAKKGWRVTVIAPEEDYFFRYQGSEDRSLLSWVSPRIQVERVRLTNWLREDDLRRKSLISAVSPAGSSRSVRRVSRYLAPLDHYPFWLWPAVVRALAVARRDPFDVILATGNPFSSFVAAGIVAGRSKRPYVLDYRDAWTFDQFSGQLKPGATDVALSMERRLLNRAAGVISVNQAILDWLVTTHSLPRSVGRRVVENGYDREFIVRTPGEDPTSNGMRFSYVGTIIPEKMDWLGVLSDFDRVAAAVDPDIRLDMYGHLGFSSPQAADLGHLFEGHGRISYHGPVDKATVARVYAGSDVLFLPMYDSPFVTSGKVYEMMATGKPILAWGKSSAGALHPLRGYPKLVRVDPSRPTSLRRGIEAAVQLARLSLPELDHAAIRYAARFERSLQLKKAMALLDSIVRRDSARRHRA